MRGKSGKQVQIQVMETPNLTNIDSIYHLFTYLLTYLLTSLLCSHWNIQLYKC